MLSYIEEKDSHNKMNYQYNNSPPQNRYQNQLSQQQQMSYLQQQSPQGQQYHNQENSRFGFNNVSSKSDFSNGKSSSLGLNQSPQQQQQQHSSTKNLSHVPCKFFKQGTCQAGNSCPFSHSLDSTLDTTPCKYFQKGNCKFGVKCALAHILPDGRRVNPKSLAQAYQQQLQLQQQPVGNGHIAGNSGSYYGSRTGSSSTHSINAPGSRRSFSFNNGIQPISIGNTTLVTPSSSVNTSNSEFLLGSQQNSFHNNSNTNFNYFNTASNISTTAPAISTISQQQLGSTTPVTSNYSHSVFQNSLWNQQQPQQQPLLQQPLQLPLSFMIQQRTLSTPQTSLLRRPSFVSFDSTPHLQGSAILDDDDDDQNKGEDFVPSSLSDLLTPQELQRRNSRPGSNSGGVSGQLLMLDVQQQQLPLHQDNSKIFRNSHHGISGSFSGQHPLILEEQNEDTQFLMD